MVEDRVSTEERRKESEARQLTVYDFDDWLGESIINRVRQAFGLVRTRPLVWGGKLHEPGADVEPLDPALAKEEEIALKAEFQALMGTEIKDSDWQILKKATFSSEIEEAIVDLLSDILWQEIVPDRERLLLEEDQGIVIRTISNNSERVARDLYPILSPKSAELRIRSRALSLNLHPAGLKRLLRPMVARLAVDLLRPNLTPNRHETERRRKEARESVKPVYYRVLRGEMVAREGQIVTHQILARLNKETETRPAQLPWLRVLGMFFLMIIFFRSLYLPVLHNQSGRRFESKDLVFVYFTILLVFSLARVIQPPIVELARTWGHRRFSGPGRSPARGGRGHAGLRLPGLGDGSSDRPGPLLSGRPSDRIQVGGFCLLPVHLPNRSQVHPQSASSRHQPEGRAHGLGSSG